MPIHRGKDSKGLYYQWGSRTKYYYTCNNKKSRDKAYEKSARQARAIYASGYKG